MSSADPWTLLLQSSMAFVVAAFSKSASWALVSVLIPFCGWTMWFHDLYPAWFDLFAFALNFLVLIPFAWAGEVHSHYWEAHPFLNGSQMYKTAKVVESEIDNEKSDKTLKRTARGVFVQRFMGMIFWRAILFLALLLGAHVVFELNWAKTHTLEAMGILLGIAAVLWVFFYFLFTNIGSNSDKAVFQSLFQNEKEMIPFTVMLAIPHLLNIAAYGLGRHFIDPVDWLDLWWWLLPLLSGIGLLVIVALSSRFGPIYESRTDKKNFMLERATSA